MIRCAIDTDISLRCIQGNIPKKHCTFDITNVPVNSNIARRTGNTRILNVYKAISIPDPAREVAGTVDVDSVGSIQGAIVDKYPLSVCG